MTVAIAAHAATARALGPVTFEVPRGSLCALAGPSGSGKTTLMRMVMGVQKGVGGTVEVLGLPAGSRELRERITYATQAASVFADLTVRENLIYFAAPYKLGKERIEEVIDQVGLRGAEGQVVRTLSGGQRSRVSLAVALLPEPELLVLDEPTVGLDPLLRRELWELFTELAAGGSTLLISSHVLDEAEHCNQLLLIRDGQLIQSTPAAVKEETGTTTIEDAFMEMYR